MIKTQILALIFFLVCACSPNQTVHAVQNASSAPVCVTVNGHYLKADHPAFLENGYTMIPIRAVSDALRADSVLWNEKDSAATIHKGGSQLQITKNSRYAWVNGKKVRLDTAAIIRNDRFFVPLRFVAETFGVTVVWDSESYTAALTAPGVSVPSHMIGNRGYSDEDLYWLSRIIHAESAGEPMRGKIAVANVVLNRVESHLFDNTIYEVVFDRKYGVQFTPTVNGTVYNTPTGDSIAAAKRALLGENTAGESLYFLNPTISTSFWIVNNRIFYKTIGNHDFYL